VHRLTLAATFFLLAGCGGQVTQPDPVPHQDVEESGADSPASTAFPAVQSGARTVVHVTFTDGTTAELVFPSELAFDVSELRPYSWGELRLGSRSVQRDFVIFRAGNKTRAALESAPSIADYADAEGRRVSFIDGQIIGVPDLDYLVFRFDSWIVAVYDYGEGAERMTEEERAAWAESFGGHETADRFLVLQSQPPLLLAPIYDDGPPFGLGFSGRGGSVELWPRIDCDRFDALDTDGSDGFSTWCDQEASMILQVSGNETFIGP
jgi:hypothetical protein